MSDPKTALEAVFSAKDTDELMDTYKLWAAGYDRDLRSLGYEAHVETAAALDRVVDSKDARILDAGSGTGLVGEELKKRGFRRLDALDVSEDMLAQARQKGIYEALYQADLGSPLALIDNAYDAVTCAGTFTYGHVPPEAFDELIRTTKPGGFICFTVREGAYETCGYRRRMLELELQLTWELISMRETDCIKNEEVSCKVFTYKVNPACHPALG